MKAADLLTKAERPAVIAGTGIWWDGAWKQLRAFAENGRLPIFLNGSGRGALPPDHPLFFQHSRGRALAEADVICVIGTPLDFRLKFGRFPEETKLVHIHADPTELGRNRTPDAGHRRRLRRSARHPRRRRQAAATDATSGSAPYGKPKRPGGTSIARRSSPTPRPSTITAWEPSSTASWIRTRS